MWVVDTNRQSLDRVVPDQKIKKLMKHFAAAGWHVVEAKYGSKLQAAFERPGGDELRRHIDDMSNEQYQSLFGLTGPELRERFLLGASTTLAALVDEYGDDDLAPLVQNLGGHDLAELIRCYRRCDEVTDRPSVVFAYTVKGWGLPDRRRPAQPRRAAATRRRSTTSDGHWGSRPNRSGTASHPTRVPDRCAPPSGSCLQRPAPTARPVVNVPISVLGSSASSKPVSSQEAFGRLLLRLADQPDVRSRLVTTSPDVSVSTNLGGWINKVGVFHPDEQPDFLGDGRLLRWKQTPAGHHIELGISEMNLFLLLHALGLGHELHGEHLLPIGTVYDPFVCRGLDALIYALYNGARFVARRYAVGRDARPRGRRPPERDHAFDRARAPRPHVRRAVLRAARWTGCCATASRACRVPPAESLYLRLSTRPIDQAPFAEVMARRGADDLRGDVIAGGYRLRESGARPPEVVLATCGPVVPEVLAAASLLEAEGLPSIVVDLTSPSRLYREWRGTLRSASRGARTAAPTFHLARLHRAA